MRSTEANIATRTRSANGAVRFTRNVGNIAMDLDGIETIACHALGGTDNVVVDDSPALMLPARELTCSASGGRRWEGPDSCRSTAPTPTSATLTEPDRTPSSAAVSVSRQRHQ